MPGGTAWSRRGRPAGGSGLPEEDIGRPVFRCSAAAVRTNGALGAAALLAQAQALATGELEKRQDLPAGCTVHCAASTKPKVQ